MALVSVIIPTYNRAEVVVRAVNSALAQTFQDVEVIVIDDGSSDQTLEVLGPYLGRIKYIRNNERQGVSAARNRGIRESSAPLVAFLDSDDYWLPEKLEAQVEFFRENREAVACQTNEIWIREGKRVNPKKKHQKPSGDIFLPSLRLCLVSPSAVMLRREVLEEVGGFDETFPVCEDYDLWLRISLKYPIYLISAPLVVKVGGRLDQLSRAFWGMDRFRIRSLIKLLLMEDLTRAQQEAVFFELKRKCTIYATGCYKRGKKAEADLYASLPRALAEALTEKRRDEALKLSCKINMLQRLQLNFPPQ